MESSVVFVQYHPFQSYQLLWSDVETDAKRIKWRKSHSKVETNDKSDRAKQWKGSIRAILLCIRRPGENQTRKSNSSESANRNTIERRDPVVWSQRADRPVVCAHSFSHSEWNVDKLGLLKSGNLMNWWTIERGDTLFAHSERLKHFSRDCKNVILEEANHDRTMRPVVCSQQAHQCVIEDDETESEFVVRIQNIHRCNTRQ